MRISTETLFETATSRLSKLQSAVAKMQEQISTGRRILTPSDDPVAAARALELSQAKAANEQLAVNRQSARHNLSMQEQVLQTVTLLIQDVQSRVVSAGNGALDNEQRQYMAAELRGYLDDLLGLANTDDGNGNYLFSGYQTSTKPFSRTAAGIQYNGDQGQRMLQVGPQRQIELSDPGSTVFEGARTGNGFFAVSAAAGNTGSGVVAIGSNSGNTPLTSNYEIRFTDATTYDVYDVGTVPETQISTGNAYVSGEQISVAGMQVEITGTPEDGDTFVLEPSRRQSLFTTLENLIGVLEQPATGASGQAALANGLAAASRDLANSLDSVLSTRASLGARLHELDSLDQQGEDRDLQYEKTLAELQELDYTKAISDLTKQSIILEAAQQSFVKTAGLSLFNFL